MGHVPRMPPFGSVANRCSEIQIHYGDGALCRGLLSLWNRSTCSISSCTKTVKYTLYIQIEITINARKQKWYKSIKICLFCKQHTYTQHYWLGVVQKTTLSLEVTYVTPTFRWRRKTLFSFFTVRRVCIALTMRGLCRRKMSVRHTPVLCL